MLIVVFFFFVWFFWVSFWVLVRVNLGLGGGGGCVVWFVRYLVCVLAFVFVVCCVVGG